MDDADLAAVEAALDWDDNADFVGRPAGEVDSGVSLLGASGVPMAHCKLQ